MKDKRIYYCDLLRLIAIIMVIAIHVFAEVRDLYVVQNIKIYFFLTLLDSFTRVGVPLFFMLTGIFMLNDKKEFRYLEFIKKRIPKLIIPLIIFSIIYYIYDSLYNNVPLSIISFIDKITSDNIKYHLWFMYYIIIIYIFIPFIKKLIQNISKREQQILITIIFIFGNVLKTINLFAVKYDYNFLRSFILPDLIIYINYVLLGYYLYNNDISKNKRKTLYILGIIFILLIPVFDYWYIEGLRYDIIPTAVSLFPFIPAIAFFTFIKNNYSKLKITKKTERMLSEISPLVFYIYMSHVLIMDLLKLAIKKVWIANSFIENMIVFVILVVGTFVVSISFSYYFNKIYNYIESKIKSITTKTEL